MMTLQEMRELLNRLWIPPLGWDSWPPPEPHKRQWPVRWRRGKRWEFVPVPANGVILVRKDRPWWDTRTYLPEPWRAP